MAVKDNNPIRDSNTHKKSVNKSQNVGIKSVHSKTTHIKHQHKLSLMRDCQIYGKSYEASKAYFNSKGYSLSISQFTNLRNELKTTKTAREWFSKEALYVMEDDHILSVDRIRMMEDRLLTEFEQVSATNFYRYINAGTDEQEIIRNKAHDGKFLLRIISQFESLQETKAKMFSATPLLQELMEVHRRQEDESQRQHFTPPPNTENTKPSHQQNTGAISHENLS